MDTRIDHPLDIDLLEYAISALPGLRSASASDHLGACLLCRIRLARIRRADIQPTAAPNAVAHPEVSQRVLAALTAGQHPSSIAPGQVWLAGDARRSLVWVRGVLENAVSVYAATLDIDAADDTTLVVDELEAIGYQSRS